MFFPGDFTNQFVPRGTTSRFDLEFENILEDHGVSWQIVDEMFALQSETCRRCLSVQHVLSALQSFKRRMCAHLLRDLAATANLPPHSALFSQQLPDLTDHKWWTEREESDIGITDVHLLAAVVCIHIKLLSARYPDRVPF